MSCKKLGSVLVTILYNCIVALFLPVFVVCLATAHCCFILSFFVVCLATVHCCFFVCHRSVSCDCPLFCFVCLCCVSYDCPLLFYFVCLRCVSCDWLSGFMLLNHCLSVCVFLFSHCTSRSMNSSFCLPLWYLQTFLVNLKTAEWVRKLTIRAIRATTFDWKWFFRRKVWTFNQYQADDMLAILNKCQGHHKKLLKITIKGISITEYRGFNVFRFRYQTKHDA